MRVSVDTARDSADITPGGPNGSPADIDPGSRTFRDLPATYVDHGEILGFVLKSAPAAAAKITYGDGVDFTPGTAADIIVRLYDGATLLETINWDITATGLPNAAANSGEANSFIVQDNLGQAFNRIEIQAAGAMNGVNVADEGARFVLTDLDFLLIG
jgi:hypothetical protein